MSLQLPEKLLKQRYKLQLVSLESPSELPGSHRPHIDPGVSPMTDLANNLSDTSLGLTPVQDSKRRLSMDSESSDSTPSPKEKHHVTIETPLTSLINKPKRFLQTSSRLSFSVGADEHENKENIPCGGSMMSSPVKPKGPLVGASRNKYVRKLSSPGKLSPLARSPLRDRTDIGPFGTSENISPAKRLNPKKPPLVKMLNDDVEDDSNSRDSGYDSQNLEEMINKKRKPCLGTMEEILQNCSPGKEEGVMPLKSSPDRTESNLDGVDFDSLETIDEDLENESAKFDSLLSNKIILPGHLDDNLAFQNPLDEEMKSLAKPIEKRSSFKAGKRPTFRRALSMLDRPTGTDFDSPVSRNSDFSLISRFKRPEPPRHCEVTDAASKRRRFNPTDNSNQTTSSRSGSAFSAPTKENSCTSSDDVERKKPKFYRSHSENELSVMKSCQLKEEVENILPDSSRLYALPSLVGGDKHPSLRRISCETLAHLIKGDFKHTVDSYRIIDARYRFEYDGGHINGAENWQHGEDEKFISAFLPPTALTAAPVFHPDDGKKREILIFHCEFSSQRGPDFYMKLRERDRQLNQHVYPALYHPECYLLHLGYKEFYNLYPELCTGTYTTMIDPKHESDLRKMRAKSKSWSGGTIMRTGRMARLHL